MLRRGCNRADEKMIAGGDVLPVSETIAASYGVGVVSLVEKPFI
jgi:hypothetical protein